MNIYLAGPDVFQPDAALLFSTRKAMLRAVGHTGWSPFDNEVTIEGEAWNEKHAWAIFEANAKMIRECDGVIANLTPFRGPSADVGTVWEIAYAHALGKRVVAFSENPFLYEDRVKTDQYSVEPFGLRDNLMLEGMLESQGMTLLDSFDDCVHWLSTK